MNFETFTPPQNQIEPYEFVAQPREFNISDVENIQRYLKELKDESLKEGASLMPTAEGMYEHLTEHKGPTAEQEQKAPEDSFDKTTHTLLQEWARQKGIAEYVPTRLEDIKDLFIQYPNINEKSPIHFQGGAEFATSRFVHIKTGRVLGKAREATTTRYYLNPTTDKIGHVVERLTGAALEAGVPLYFKFVDVATESPNSRTLSRNDRVVIYASDGQREFIEDTLKGIVTEMPEGFEGRTVTGFAEEIADGIARSDEVNEAQNQISGEKESFNSLRTKLIFEATMSLTRLVLAFEQNASIQVDGRTVRGILADAVSKELNKYNYPAVQEDDPTLLQALAHDLDGDNLAAAGFNDKAIGAISTAVRSISKDVLPSIPSDVLLRGYERQLDNLAPRYGINPHNLSENIPIVA